jgi:uncharacterized protein
MEKLVKWRGLEHDSIETCRITSSDEGIVVKSEIAGRDLSMRYEIRTDPHWLTIYCALSGQLANFEFQFLFERGRNKIWKANGLSGRDRSDSVFDQCDYVDISLTPFTNTLPINNLVLPEKEAREIKVVYFDFSEQTIRPVRQRYTKLSADLYHYENVPNDFEADIRVDADGLVVDYPGLFSRVF